MARTRKKPEERRLELIEAARRLFREKGYSATNVTDIIKEVGISQGTFYIYFDGKEAVFDAVAEAIVLEGYDVIKGIVTQEDLPVLEKIKRIMSYLMTLETAERWTDELAARRLRHMRDRVGVIGLDLYTPLVTDIIKQGVDEGLMHVLHPEATAAFFLAGTWAFLDVLKGNDVLSSEEWWESYLDFIVRLTGIEEKIALGIGGLEAPPSSDGD
ncbi:MAG: TetR/AcrR family transcriptional regulator [Actinobacteria bacterium]|nr:TetR/AcrR family transcriptional regulator [Actinomycetota bacterium]